MLKTRKNNAKGAGVPALFFFNWGREKPSGPKFFLSPKPPHFSFPSSLFAFSVPFDTIFSGVFRPVQSPPVKRNLRNKSFISFSVPPVLVIDKQIDKNKIGAVFFPFFLEENVMATNNAIEVCESREWRRNGRTLVKLIGDSIEIPALKLDLDEQSAVCFVLLSRLSERIGMAPFAVDATEVEHVLDALSSVAEFPGVNRA
jgi:hypothetical protein